MKAYTLSHNYKKIILLFVIGAQSLIIKCQIQQESIMLNWKSPVQYTVQDDDYGGITKTLLFFEKAIYTMAYGSLPVFSDRLNTPGYKPGFQALVKLNRLTFEPVPEAELSFLSQISSSEMEVSAWIQIERKRSFVRFEFTPFRKNPVNGKLERLVSFTPDLSWTIDPSSEKMPLKSHIYKSQSVLAEGKWHKIAVKQTGIHKITYDKLTELGFSTPETIRVFGNGGQQLPYNSSLERPDDLVENPVYIYKGSDGVFNSGDYILFYAEGVIHWTYDRSNQMFVHRLHLYSDESYYYLTDTEGEGLRVSNVSSSGGTPTHHVNSYDFYSFREKDSVNLLSSGRLWVWKHFNSYLNYDFNITIDNKLVDAPVKILSSLLVRSTKTASNSSMLIKVDNQNITSINFPGVNTSNYEALFASSITRKIETEVNKDNFILSYQLIRSNPAANAWLNYFDINSRSHLTYNNKPLQFRDLESVGQNNITEYQISGGRQGLLLWDVTDIGEVKSVSFSVSGNVMKTTRTSDDLKEYIIFDPTDPTIHSPIFDGDYLGEVPNQNLHGLGIPDMVIIVQDELREFAVELAELHSIQDDLESLIVVPDQIYNEFSSGIPDPTAIRDFMKMFYEKSLNSEPKLKYLLLFGDGSYDNKKARTEPEFRNCLPTYQSLESLYPTSSYVTDDFFGLLDQGESLEQGLLDIGIGRFPVTSTYQAAIMVDKVKHYTSTETLGNWRNLICFIGDDEDGNAHMRDANTLAEIIITQYPSFNVDKIFLDAYQQVVTASGETYPEVNRAINDRIKKGALIMNYLGHGSAKGLAHENILGVSEIRSWDNYDKLPLFMTATCEFSRFDDDQRVSAGEEVLLNPRGGGIGLFSTTRLVYSSPNFRLNREFYDYVFDRPGGGRYRFGDLIRLTKNAVGSELNKLNFTLLADPAISLNFPENKIIVTHVNGQQVGKFTDTLKALSQVEIKGFIANTQGQKIENYQGIIYPTVYDKEVIMTNLSNDGGPTMEFSIQENILFRGKSSINDGTFKFNFIVPKDIGYNVGNGKFSFYGTNSITDAAGVELSILIGGSADSLIQDSEGPSMELYMNDTTFVYGGSTNEDPVLLARVSDNNGINTTGNGIGHDITAILDGNKQDILVLNDYYESDLDNFKAGTIRYPLNDLEPGSHEIKLKVWDILNNSSESNLRFEVYSSEQVILKNLLNYPNPFTTQTAFYFEHNQAGQALDAQIQIYTVSGRLVKSFDFLSATETQVEPGKFRVGPIYWDGLDQYGDRIGRGTYFYRVKIRTPEGRSQEAYQKLVKL